MRSPKSRGVVLGSLLIGLSCRPAPTAVPGGTGDPAAQPDATAAAGSPEPELTPLVKPQTLPPVPPFEAAPTAALPKGAPTAEGRISRLIAVDDQRAVIQFIVPGQDWDAKWWLALMNRDGTIAWTQTVSGRLEASHGGSGIEIVGDALSIMLTEIRGNDPVMTLHVLALADGTRRSKTELGKGFDVGITSDGERRYDVRRHYGLGRGKDASELIVSDHRSVQWRASLDEFPDGGPEPSVIGDVVVVRTRGKDNDHSRWNVFERRTGKPRGQVLARTQGCSDGERWFVLEDDGLLSVDPKTLRTRRVTGNVAIPQLPGTWMLADCSVAGGNPVVLVERGFRKALVIFDGATFEPLGQVILGVNKDVVMGHTGYDPMPRHLAAKGLIEVMTTDGQRELMIIDSAGGRMMQQWSAGGEYSLGYARVQWPGGTVLSTRHTLAMVDARTGQLAGQAMVPEDIILEGQQIAGSVLWLPPFENLTMGSLAPRIIDLSVPADDDIRGAVLADLNPRPASPRGGRAPCPDPSAPLIGDGTGTDGTIVPVKPTRLPTWDLDIVHESARIIACAPGAAPSRLMAWHIMEDDRPLRNDYALVMVEDTTVEPPRFTLVELSRHAVNREWHASAGSVHSSEEPVRTFDHRPTRDEIDEYLAQVGWTFRGSWGRLLAGNVVDEEWRAATHAAPWRSYPKGLEQPD